MSDVGSAGTTSRFWEELSLENMSDSQWESLCDGCGRCCLHKLEDADTATVYYTRVACTLLDSDTARCKDYSNRFAEVPDCLSMRPMTDDKRRWLPDSCAYRRVSEGRGLADWHPLISGSAETVLQSGVSVAGKTLAENDVPLHEWVEHTIDLDDFIASVYPIKPA